MTADGGLVLVVDDSSINRKLLLRALEAEGHEAEAVANGALALERMHAAEHPFDVVLLDIVMPVLDGYQTLARIKADETLRHVPVIVISSVDELASVVRCIELGATDYLPKPFDRSILAARLNASLAGKRLRDLELEYLEQVALVIDAALALEADAFEPASLSVVAAREDTLGQLARTFARMASQVQAREERLRRQVEELRIEIDVTRRERKVAEIVASDYFRDLRGRAAELRRIVDPVSTASEGGGDPEP